MNQDLKVLLRKEEDRDILEFLISDDETVIINLNSEDSQAEFKSAFLIILKQLQFGNIKFQLDVQDGYDNQLIKEVCEDYIIDLNNEIKEVYEDMIKKELVE